MDRPQRVKAVYLELRRASSSSISAGDLLEYAGQLVDAFTQDEQPRFGLRLGGRPFDEWALDVVFADGGWRVLDRYSVRTFDGDDEAVNDPLTRRSLEELGLEMCA
jgi:hypothetical protein